MDGAALDVVELIIDGFKYESAPRCRYRYRRPRNKRPHKGERRCIAISEINDFCRRHYLKSLNEKQAMKNPPVEVTKRTYRSYLVSPRWKETRRRFFKSGMWRQQEKKCFCCYEESEYYHLHHKTYHRTGDEHLTDLVAVCPGCHEMIELAVKFKKRGKVKRRWSFPKRLKKMIRERGKKKAYAYCKRKFA